jgi:hypothetical protein
MFVTAVLLAGCTSKVATVKTIRPGVLLIGSENTYPPFEMTVGNQFVGFDVDVANAVAARLGLRPQIVKTTFGKIIPGLQGGNYDVTISAMTITPERAKVIFFSKPYMTADQSICVRLASDIKEQAGLAGKTVGVEKGRPVAQDQRELRHRGEEGQRSNGRRRQQSAGRHYGRRHLQGHLQEVVRGPLELGSVFLLWRQVLFGVHLQVQSHHADPTIDWRDVLLEHSQQPHGAERCRQPSGGAA